MPGKDMPSVAILEFDKVVHFGLYFMLSILMYYGWKNQNSILLLHNKTITKILILTSTYGFAVEVMQELFTADRHFDLFDALANSAGAIAGSLMANFLLKKFNKVQSQKSEN